MTSPVDGGGAGVAGGALSGAAAGSMFGPWGAAAGAGIGLVGSALSGVIGAEGAATKAKAEASMYSYKAAVARANASVADENVALGWQDSSIKELNQGMRDAQHIGEMKAAQGASGIVYDTNNPNDSNRRVRDAAQTIAEENQSVIMSDASRKAYGFAVEKQGFLQEAALEDSAAANAKTAGKINVAASLLGGATSVADKWTKFSQQGVFG